MADPGQVFVIGPLTQAAPLLDPSVRAVLAQYAAASTGQQMAWASAYDKALDTITPDTGGDEDMGVASPEYTKIATLQGDFGPVPVLTQTDLQLAQTGYLKQYLLSYDPGHSFHLVNIWLYDHRAMMNTATDNGLTDDQWGMVKERGFAVGPGYLFLSAVIHVELPNGDDGAWFVIYNFALAFFLLFAVPLLPGLPSLPERLKPYRFICRYPKTGELEKPELAVWPEGYHGRVYTKVEMAAAAAGANSAQPMQPATSHGEVMA